MVHMMENATAAKVVARQIFDSRGKPTIEVDLWTDDGVCHRAAVPSGASTGVHEALELRDGESTRFHGQGVSRAVKNVNEIIGPFLVSSKMDLREQEKIDQALLKLDGTANKSKLGANAILGVSLAVANAGAAAKKVPLYKHIADLAGNKDLSLPVPSFNIVNGGSHAGNKIAFQEFMIMPLGAESFTEAMRIGCEVYQTLKTLLKEKLGSFAVNVGDEGGFAPNIDNVEECLDLICSAVKTSGHWEKVRIALDVAASEFFQDGSYNLDVKDKSCRSPRVISGGELANVYEALVKKYPIVSIEDAFDQDDLPSWQNLCAKLQVQIVGDDLTVTNPQRIQMAIDAKACNALLLKVNQIGTLTESIQAAQKARLAGWNIMVSHRSGETEDTFIADLAVGLGAGQIKSGAPCRSERLAKYNRLLRIEEEMGSQAVLAKPLPL